MADAAHIEIRNPDVVRDIRELAARTGKPEADAVAEAVRARLALGAPNNSDPIAARRQRIKAALALSDSLPHLGEVLADADLYDEDGMPR